MNTLLLACILSIMPIFELRAGLPIAIVYAVNNNLPVIPIFLMIVFLNIIVIIPIFLFLDYAHHRLHKRFNFYRKSFEFWLSRIQKKIDRVEEKKGLLAFTLLMLFVAIPLPGTGAWTGSLIAWILGLEKKKSFLAVSLGVIIAGILLLLGTIGVLGFLN